MKIIEINLRKILLKFKDIFKSDLYIEISRHNLSQEEKSEDTMLDFAYKHNIAIVATNNVFFATKNMFEAHDALLCIASGRYVSEDERKKSNTEYYFKTEREIKALFYDLPEAISNTIIIAKKCSVKSKEHQPIFA